MPHYRMLRDARRQAHDFLTRLAAMKKLLLLAILVGLAAFAAKKVRAA